MRLLQRRDTGEFRFTKYFAADEAKPPYAILSHMWEIKDDQETTFEDIVEGTGENKKGYSKIQFCAQQARSDGLEYFWVDTCCIKKSDPVELQNAINSMFRWYQNAAKCYVYLSDVSKKPRTASSGVIEAWGPAFERSKWFSRGWTLQELLAPDSVEFFSREQEKLGDKRSLRQEVHSITGIPDAALEGAPLGQFNDKERFSWMQYRETKIEEDKAYALLGIFGVRMPLRYGEGYASASSRLDEEINKLNGCLRDLRVTDPRDDKNRIEETKGGLLKDSYQWMLRTPEFQQWRYDGQSRLLWIKGDPGKGKTMLLCGVIDELNGSMDKTTLLSYFFCQATDSHRNNAMSVLRGLLYLLIKQQPLLVSHLRQKHDQAGKALFEDANSWVVLSDIFTNILQDPNLNNTYLVVDALDECRKEDLPKLLDFISQNSCISTRVKWIVSSRNWSNIEETLDKANQKVRLHLELNEDSISQAVDTYIGYKVEQLAILKKYDEKTKNAVATHLASNAKGTFLWVALVYQQLADPAVQKRHTLTRLKKFPPGLDPLYKRMLEQIYEVDDADLCKKILALASVVYRPVTLSQVQVLSKSFKDYDDDDLSDMIKSCGSFLTLREDVIFFVHQSAKDFLLEKAYSEVLPLGIAHQHQAIFSRSIQALSSTLQRNMYNLSHPGFPIDQALPPNPDPLSTIGYSCVYWIDHLCDWLSTVPTGQNELQDGDIVDTFLQEKYLYWLEALSLLKKMPEGVIAVKRLDSLIHKGQALTDLVHDAHRFIRSHKHVIENTPLQAYASALVFSPVRSKVRELFEAKESQIKVVPPLELDWSPCLQTLIGHSGSVWSVVFSADGTKLASGSDDNTVKVWDTASGQCMQTLEGHSSSVFSVVFSADGIQLASGLRDTTNGIYNCQTVYGRSTDKSWITKNGQNVLWLPFEYRPGDIHVFGQSVSVGCTLGKVFIVKFL